MEGEFDELQKGSLVNCGGFKSYNNSLVSCGRGVLGAVIGELNDLS